MNRKRVLMLFAMILFLSGCTDFFMICSLNPFYLEKNITLIPEIEGSWTALPLHFKSKSNKKDEGEIWRQADTTSIWKFERSISKETVKTPQGKDSTIFKVMNFYHAFLLGSKSDTTRYQFKMVLFRVNKVLYADFMPIENTGLEKSRIALESYFRIHTLARLVIRDNHPEFSWLGATDMKDMIEKKRVRVSYRWVKDAGRLLLTGNAEQLTGMIERYAGEPRFIEWDNQSAMLKLNRIN
jgi:hypothetical protein